MHDGMPYGRNQGQGQGHSREVDRQSPTGLIFSYYPNPILLLGYDEFCLYNMRTVGDNVVLCLFSLHYVISQLHCELPCYIWLVSVFRVQY